ncbi:peptidase M61 [Flavobacterium sp. 316]|uniref:Peptidase M61 n=1 Tax=Flavobacterium sediminilitoris TaxID=2024526 RepID=A0ABY4HMT6_9FLAO|nr:MULTISPECIES: peptidase M61 [Flavobacterium]KIX19755.1 peptidase M61 [Flavobacterium sp. 316]UOX33981.1 peptidase M61 [Flavobacterium sediminilitoris]
MKKIILSLAIASFIWSCKTSPSTSKKEEVDVLIDLVNVQDDKVTVTISTPTFTTETTTFNIPKTVPGTYSEDDYGRYIENVRAFDASGNGLRITKITENSYKIDEANKLSKITYLVNDTYDTEKGGGFGESEDVFSPAGTNIKAGENFMLNTHGFVGYFEGKESIPYKLTITHPANLQGVSAMVDTDDSPEKDIFISKRYADLVDMPLMYSKPDITTFMVDDMEIIISVYSPTGKYTAADITPNMETMMKAQKRFLGPINSTKKYAILLYLSDVQSNDAKGFGALEHTTSTTVVMPEMMELEALQEQLKDVVSHEFFHIVTPLSVHSNEIHYFDFINPKMSEHLWMYEGVTEYFANLFQVNQGLITENEFYERMSQKIDQAKRMDDKMSFTKMSKNVLKAPYKDQYINVYQKGALIAMCMDILIRENSNGQKGILNLMQDLSHEYGSKKPFKDEELFGKITALTYPAVGEFLTKYVAGETPIPYNEFFNKMGVTETTIEVAGNPFLKGQMPYITIDQSTKEIIIIPSIELNDFMNSLGLKGNDRILAVNGVNYNLDNIYDLVVGSMNWKDDEPITVKIKRDGKEQEIKGTIKMPKEKRDGYQSTDNSKKAVKEAWLKG